ncbi:MAG: tetratricopeptide repeat protein, partial [bacterium]
MKENNFTHLLETNSPSDSIFQHYSLDELIEFQKYYKNATDSLLKEQEKLQQREIQNLEVFLKSHPNSPILDKIIIRLANLLYEQASQDFEDVNDEYNRLMTLYNEKQIQEIPEEPVKDFRRPLSLYQQIIDEFPHSKLIDDAIYNKGYLLEESGKSATAYQAFKELVDTFPESPYVPDALMRMAEYYFNPPVNNLEKAIELYKIVLNYQESSKYDAALYRLGWAYYRLSDYPQAISYFTILADDIDRFEQLDPNANYHFPAVREEAIEYIGISFLDYGGPNRAAQYFKEIGGRSYGFDVLKKIGDAYMEVKEEYGNAINAYQLLLSMYPDSPEAPAIQAKIAEAYRSSEDENMVYTRRAELFQKYKSDGEWWDKIENPSAKKEAMVLAEKAIRDNINLMLKKAEKTKDSNLYLQAIEDSRDYLATFSADSNAALIHWNMALTLDTKLGMHQQAFDEYIKISNLYWNSNFQKQAAENAIAIADEAIKADSLEQERTALAFTNDDIRDGLTAKDSLGNKLKLQKIELTPDELQLVAALENYIKLFPDEPETAKILAKTGSLYYDHHQFKESIKYFKTLVKHYPDSPEANYARYITMESYFGKSDYESTEILARRLKDSSPEYASKANKRLSESLFLQAETYAESSDHLSAAEEYRRIVTEVPTSEFADLALYNSSLEYERAKEYEKAVDSYRQLLNNYPQSEHSISALNNLAFDYRELNDYHNAALTYEQLAAAQPNQNEAQVALYNASVSFVQAEEWQQAIRINTKFVERFPDAEDADELLFNNANYYFKLNDIANANKIYEDFANKFPDSPRAVEAHYHRGMYFKEHNLLEEAKSEFDKAITKNTHLKEINKETNELFAAEALFQLTEIKFDEFKNIKFKLPAEILAQNKAKKKALLLEIVDNYTKVAAYGTIRLYEGTYKIGYAYEDFADTWAKQDMP